MAARSRKTGDIVRLKITLYGSKPPIWRRLLVPAGFSLRDLHKAIQAAFGWDDLHLHAFDINGEQYGDPDTTDDVANEARLTLAAIMPLGVRRIRYTYDFGDDWVHVIDIEGAEPPADGKSYPTCTAGKRAAPPEDCGGIWGYEELLEILADTNHPERAERLEWLGGKGSDPEEIAFDPAAFSMAEVNAALAGEFASAR